MSILKSLTLRIFGGKIQATGPSLTFLRLCTSRHLNDLQQIATATFLIYGLLLVPCVYYDAVGKNKVLTFSALTTIVAAILSWTYQTGSKRIGTIDLFANEIAVICRVCLIVGFAEHSIALASAGAGSKGELGSGHRGNTDFRTKFVSQEQYTPIYDRNAADLQPFEVDVVASVTRFYIYRKTMVDYLRMLAVYEGDIFYLVKKHMIYMQYLMYESAREAITLLIEFQPNQAESLINILCSEFVLFPFLVQHYKNDFRGERLQLRTTDYGEIMLTLKHDMEENRENKNWDRMQITYPELRRRYAAMRDGLNLSFMPDL